MTSEGAATSKALVIHSPTTTTALTVADPHPPPPRKKKYFSAPVKYMECLKNHAASIGGSATDGCGEFIAGGEEGTLEGLICCACKCHRNFHRKIQLQLTPEVVDMRRRKDEEGEASGAGGGGRKRFRSKFNQEQREKMQSFAEKSGWKLQKVGDAEVRSFCEEIGVKRKVLKVWMHNNKYQFANKIIN